MTQSRSTSAAAIVASLAEPPRISSLHPIAGRFVFALRLIALHDRAKRDPIPELATRLGSVEVASKALALAHTISATWPDDINVSRFCCGLMSHDEATIGNLVESAANRDRAGFESAIAGLIRPDRVQRLWEPVIALVAAEARAA